jgi:hypothetical protein
MKFTKAKIGALAGAAVLAVSLAAACSSGGGGSSAHSSGYAFSQAAISGNTSEGADLTQAQTADDKPPDPTQQYINCMNNAIANGTPVQNCVAPAN